MGEQRGPDLSETKSGIELLNEEVERIRIRFGTNVAGAEKEIQDLKRRTGYLEGEKGEELFDTKILEIKLQGSEQNPSNQILALSREPGSANCLAPVINELLSEGGVGCSIITDGRAQAVVQQIFATNQQQTVSPLGADRTIAEPDLILVAAAEVGGLETYADATFDDVPMVLVEDYPGSTHQFIRACLDRPGFHLPSKICVMDEAAKELMMANFEDTPDLEARIEVTGQPAFDRIARENVAEISVKARREMGLNENDKVISFMSTLVPIEQIEGICRVLKSLKGDFTFIFRKHPRDNASYEDYFAMFEREGIKYADSRELKTDEVSAASDIVMTTYSTAGIEAIYRGKPTIHVIDPELLDIPDDLQLPLPVAKLGASLAIEDVHKLPQAVSELLDTESPLFRRLSENMAKHYPNDGRNAKRVADVVRELLGQKQ